MPRIRAGRVVAAMATLALVLAGCSTASGTPAPPAGGELAWTDCGDGFVCSTLPVPRDWAQPQGEKLDLRLIKLPARAQRAGSVFVNWGGPGAPGTTSMRQHGQEIADATGGTLDIVSWDPRGLAESSPIRCPEGNRQYFDADAADPAGLRSMADAAQQRLAACSARYGDQLQRLGTVQGVLDLEAIRVATGEATLNFLGHSYGTRVGTTYAAMFPATVGNMVLDGSMSHRGSIRDTAVGMARSSEASLGEWFARCAAKPDCAFGPDPAAGFDALVAKVRAEQPVVPGTNGARLTVGLLDQVFLAGLVDYSGSQQAAEQAIAGYRASGDPSTLYAVGAAIAGLQPDGTYSNGPEIFQFVNCADWTDRPTFDEVAADTAEANRSWPRVGAFALTYAYTNQTACPPVANDRLPMPEKPVAGKVLIMANTFDAETPLENGQELNELLAGSRLVEYRGLGHTGFYRSACLAEAGGRLLTTGEQPPAGLVCTS